MQTHLFSKAIAFENQNPDWITPPEVARPVIRDSFDLQMDVCATMESAQCNRFYTEKDDCFEQEWEGDCWMNPRYGAEIKYFLAKAAKEVKVGRARVVCLLPSNMDFPWWRAYCEMWPFLFWPERIYFINPQTGVRGTQPANGNVLVAMGYKPEELPPIEVRTRSQGVIVPTWFSQVKR